MALAKPQQMTVPIRAQPGPNPPVTNMPVMCHLTLPVGFCATDAGIYGPAMPSQTAPLLFDLGQPDLITNIVVLESWSGTTYSTNVILGCVTNLNLTPQQLNEFNAGLLYLNVTSSAYPGGEIRGQFSNQPILSQPVFQNGVGVTFEVTGASQVNYEVQVSTDLVNWTAFTNVYSTNIAFQIVNTGATNMNGSQRFYRVMTPGGGLQGVPGL